MGEFPDLVPDMQAQGHPNPLPVAWSCHSGTLFAMVLAKGTDTMSIYCEVNHASMCCWPGSQKTAQMTNYVAIW